MDNNSTGCLKVVMDVFMYALDITGTPGNYKFSGPIVTILHIIEQHLDLCFMFVKSKHRDSGRLLPNGSWTGILGTLQRKEMDFLGTMYTLLPERIATLDFSEHLYIDEMNAVYLRPGVSPDMAGFMKPYTPLVWISLFLASLLVFVVLHAILCGADVMSNPEVNFNIDETAKTVSINGSKKVSPRKLKQSHRTIEKSAAWTWHVLLAQSVRWTPSKSLPRCTVGLWLLISFTLSSVYRSNLKAMLISPRVHLPFTSLKELADSGIPTVVTSNSAILHQIMRADDTSNLGRLRNQLVTYYLDESEWIYQQTLKGRHAVIAFGLVIRGGMHATFSMMGSCMVFLMPRGFLGPLTLSLAFPKDSPLRNKFDHVIVRLRESGITNKIFSDSTINATDCLAPLSFMAPPTQRPLQPKDFYGVFLLLTFGLLLATGIFVAEVVAYKSKQTHYSAPWMSEEVKEQSLPETDHKTVNKGSSNVKVSYDKVQRNLRNI